MEPRALLTGSILCVESMCRELVLHKCAARRVERFAQEKPSPTFPQVEGHSLHGGGEGNRTPDTGIFSPNHERPSTTFFEKFEKRLSPWGWRPSNQLQRPRSFQPEGHPVVGKLQLGSLPREVRACDVTHRGKVASIFQWLQPQRLLASSVAQVNLAVQVRGSKPLVHVYDVTDGCNLHAWLLSRAQAK